jgi:hypothetical protein
MTRLKMILGHEQESLAARQNRFYSSCMSTALNSSLTFELVGQEALVHDAAGGLVVRLTGDEHSVIQRLTSGEQIVQPTEGEQAAIDRLIEAGIVLDDEASSSKFSRRKVMQLSAAGVAAAGLSYLVLPSAAAASSVGDFNPGGEIPGPTTGAVPTADNTSINRESGGPANGNISVRWFTGDGNVYMYRWTVFRADGSRVATGVLNSSPDLTLVANFTGAGFVRFYYDTTIYDRPFSAT